MIPWQPFDYGKKPAEGVYVVWLRNDAWPHIAAWNGFGWIANGSYLHHVTHYVRVEPPEDRAA